MKCIVPGPNVKVLGRAIHSLAKLGDDLYVEFGSGELSFRTANGSRTSYATFQFSADFFSFFSAASDNSSKNSLKCQISMRSSLSVFRSPSTLDRTVDSLHIQLNSNGDKLVFLVKYKKGFIKTHLVPVIDCKTLQAYYLKENAPNRLVVQPKIVCEILSNLQNSQQEITWKVTKDNLIVKNYFENDDSYSGVRTEITVDKREFDEFKIQNETEITFCLKELRAVLLFSDNVALPLTVHFIASSKPIVFAVKGEVFEADIVVSTLNGSDYVDSHGSGSQREADNARALNGTQVDVDQNLDDFLSDVVLNNREMSPANVTARAKAVSGGREILKKVFKRCFQVDEFDVRNMPGYNVVLAADSDADGD